MVNPQQDSLDEVFWSTPKVFRCTYPGCDKTLASEKGIRQHFDKVHKGKVWRCEEEGCDGVFSDPSTLRVHVKKKHSVGV
jgi:hypothetical protein